MSKENQIDQGKHYLNRFGFKPKTGIILHPFFANCISPSSKHITIETSDIPGFPSLGSNSVKHQIILDNQEGKDIIALTPGLYYYQGYSMLDLAYPVRLFKSIGVNSLILTDHCVSVFNEPQDPKMMIVSDHINLMGSNPLIGPNNSSFGPRFPDMTYAYSKNLRKVAHQIASKLGMEVNEGIYASVTGPQFSSKSELDFMRIAGAQMAGFTLSPEVISAVHCQISCLGIVSVHHSLHEEMNETFVKQINHFVASILAEI